ncbi:hypothetical protein B0A49_04593 [Cryomyces minteri]|uniref:Nucleoside phosphorylase domain-containing protein n=1 Tax=Cryomyces minteri TaxID=331657 RepID=A0A4U0X867_9PEZI|nr:hypothetical protein B0A49_04593 [Cryomyces minteri]
MSQPRRTRQDYTIGVICALATEKAAVEVMLDEEHPCLDKIEGDDNDYTFGSIGFHNIAVACLPDGKTGNNSAATVAKDMLRSFPIKIGLMVGIGGGVWSEEVDVRLGDVVVSQPEGKDGGVVQWDFGKTEQGGVFRRTGSLNGPPRVLLNALQNIKTRHLRARNKLPEHLSKMVMNNPHMAEKFGHQGAEHDLLFRPSYGHKSGETCAECDVHELVERLPARTSSDPVIHYGKIASGNQVVKDSVTRDEVAKREGIICFEMEAAGLMDTFPCLVIRGISDYADSHKNKRWQPYAAATAAAFAKELLGVISKQGVEELEPAKKLKPVKELEPATSNVHWLMPRNVNTFFTGRKDLREELKQKLLPTSVQCPEAMQRRFILIGIGGAGKSEVCLKFAEDNRERFWGVFWIDASSTESAKRGFVRVAEMCDVQDKSVDGARDWLANTKHTWLIILGNCDDPDFDYSRYFPPGNRGSILLTTRVPECAIHETVGPKKIEKLDVSDATTLLLKAAGVDKSMWEAKHDDVKRVIEVLSLHALAIVQAGAYIRNRLCTLNEYPDLFRNQRKRLLKYRPKQAASTYGDVYATFEVSAKVLETSSEPEAAYALDLLNILAFMHNEGVPESVFTEAWEYSQYVSNTIDERSEVWKLSGWHVAQACSPRFMAHGLSDKMDIIPLREARNLLASYSIITLNNDDDISMHPLAHAWAKDRMEDARQRKSWAITGSILALANRDDASWREYSKRLQPHVEHNLAMAYMENGQHERAIELLEEVVKIRKTTLPPEHLYRVRSEKLLAYCLENSSLAPRT